MAQQPQQQSSGGGDTMKWLIIGGGALFLFDKFFGKSESEKKTDEQENKLDLLPPDKNPLNQQYAPSKIPKGTIIIRSTKTKPAVPAGYFGHAAKGIKDAIGTFTDDESAILANVKKAATKSEVAVISKVYSVLYKRDLLFDLKDNLNSKELLPILTYINKLPDYIKGVKLK